MEIIKQDIQHGIGAHVVESHPQYPEGAKPLVVVNFDNPWNLLSEPVGDDYLSGLAALSAGKNEAALVFTMFTGLQTYYRQEGLVDPSTEIIEVPHRGGKKYGFPHGDPLEQIRQELNGNELRDEAGRRYVLVPTLAHDKVHEQARAIGVATLEQPHADRTNNKAELRAAASDYGIPLLPGRLIQHGDRLWKIAWEYRRSGHGLWLKFPTGSGGDLVYRVHQPTWGELRRAVRTVRETVHSAFEHGALGMHGEDFWPESRIAPEKFPLVVEEDARNIGEVVVLGSNHFTVSPDGIQVNGYFRQITGPDGEFIGSEKFHPDAEIKAQIDEVTRRTGVYCQDMGQFGVQGLDYFVVRQNDGALVTYVLELNGRPPISSYPDIIGKRVGINSWKNVNVTLPTAVESMGDFSAIIGDDLYKRGSSAGIVPMAFRTIVDADDGTIASPHVKMVILGSEEDQQQIIQRLQVKGVKIGQTV